MESPRGGFDHLASSCFMLRPETGVELRILQLPRRGVQVLYEGVDSTEQALRICSQRLRDVLACLLLSCRADLALLRTAAPFRAYRAVV